MTIPYSTLSSSSSSSSPSTNWCPDCQSHCYNHVSTCTICGATLTIEPPAPAAQQRVVTTTSTTTIGTSFPEAPRIRLFDGIFGRTSSTTTSYLFGTSPPPPPNNSNNNNNSNTTNAETTTETAATTTTTTTETGENTTNTIMPTTTNNNTEATTTTTNTNTNNNNNGESTTTTTPPAVGRVVLLLQNDIDTARSELNILIHSIREQIDSTNHVQNELLNQILRETLRVNHIFTFDDNPNIPTTSSTSNGVHSDYLEKIPRIRLQPDSNLLYEASLSVFVDHHTTMNHNLVPISSSTPSSSVTTETTTNELQTILRDCDVIPPEFGIEYLNRVREQYHHHLNNMKQKKQVSSSSSSSSSRIHYLDTTMTTTENIDIAANDDNMNNVNNNSTTKDVPMSSNDDDDDSIFFNIRDAYLVIADPITGLGGHLDPQCIEQMDYIRNYYHHAQHHNNKNNTNTTDDDSIPSSEPRIILFFTRGNNVTFVQKALIAQKYGAIGCIIGNNIENPWPYSMKDSKQEAANHHKYNKPNDDVGPLNIPAVMTSLNDTQKIMQAHIVNRMNHLDQYQNNDGQQQQQPMMMTPLKCHYTIRRKNQNTDSSSSCGSGSGCIICTEEFASEQTILKLPCHHYYHESCAVQWLTYHNTCPYCRYELPTTDESTMKQRRNQQHNHSTSSTSNSSTVGNNNNNNETFYG